MLVDQKVNKAFLGVYLIDGDFENGTIETTKEPSKFKKHIMKWFLKWKWVSVKELKEKTSKKDGN